MHFVLMMSPLRCDLLSLLISPHIFCPWLFTLPLLLLLGIKNKKPNKKWNRLPLFFVNKDSALVYGNLMVLEGILDSRGEQPARLLGQTQTGQQADDQVHDEEQQVHEPPAETHRHE